jgi:SAM-dependent methyltransferase
MNDPLKEAEFFDKQAGHLLSADENTLVVKDPYTHLAGSKVAFDYMNQCIGNVRGKSILDVGCGCGWFSIFLAQKGARYVHGFDISPKMIEVAKKRASVNNVSDKINFRAYMAEEIRFDDNMFDLIVGISVLHHIDLKKFSDIMTRILNKDGKAIFIEPLGENKIIEFVRNKINLGFLGERTEEEKPLTFESVSVLTERFTLNHKEFQLFGSVAKYFGDSTTSLLGLNILDSRLLKLFPSMAKRCRLIVLELMHK